MKERIFLWSNRRTCSFALQRAIFQIEGIQHIGEPFALPFYFGENRKSTLLEDYQKWPNPPTWEEQIDKVLNFPDDNYERAFVAEHCLHVCKVLLFSVFSLTH